MELQTTWIFERFSTMVSKNKQCYICMQNLTLHKPTYMPWEQAGLNSNVAACNDDVISLKTKVCDSWNFEKRNVSPN